MTRPIYEPTPTRKDAYLDFQQQQLFRRPRPAGGGEVQIFRATRSFDVSSVTVGSGGSQVTVDFNIWNWCDDTVFCPLDTGLNPDPTPGIDQVRRVRLGDCGTGYLDTVPGTYDVYFGAVPTSTFDGNVEIAMHDGDDTYAYADAYYHSLRSGFGSAFISAMWSKVYPIWDFEGSEGSVAELSFTIAQINAGGTNKTFRPCWLEIHFNPNVNVCGESSS